MVRFYIDSDVFFYARIMDKTYGRSCSALLRQMATKELDAVASMLVPVEVANAMVKYGFKREVSNEIRAIISLGLELYPIDAADLNEAAGLFVKTGASPHDCLHAAVMKKCGLREIVSADRDFDGFRC